DGKRLVSAMAINGALPGTEIRVKEGDQLRLQVENRLAKDPTSIHWHGILVPAVMDGVPDVSTFPIPPPRIFVAEFPLLQSGTYWYPPHYDLQEQLGVSGAFIIEPRHEPVKYDRDCVILLSDWLYSDPAAAYEKLRAGDSMKGSMGDMAAKGVTPSGGGMAGGAGSGMAMNKPDLSDLTYDAFLLNGKGNQDPWACVARR